MTVHRLALALVLAGALALGLARASAGAEPPEPFVGFAWTFDGAVRPAS